MKGMIIVIINADDFGINMLVTKEIERMVEVGAISSTTILANGQCLDEVQRFSLEHPQVSYGVHLCLSEFGSITKSPTLLKYGLIDSDGIFIRKQIFKIKKFNEELKQAIKDELIAQIEVVKSLGITISHADSHHHVHTIYPLRRVFSEVLQTTGISKIRLGSGFMSLRARIHLYSWIRRIRLNNYYRSLFKTTNKFFSYSNYLRIQNKLRDNCVVELMCHPGHQGLSYRKEMEEVEKKELILNNKIISYYEL
jgi:predicted glycoside hydrolase/deacetylase ChbG (UPF0249 family)